MAFYSLSEAEQHIMDYMWAHADQEEIHLNEIMEYMEDKRICMETADGL